jgi:hypothetical protein
MFRALHGVPLETKQLFPGKFALQGKKSAENPGDSISVNTPWFPNAFE